LLGASIAPFYFHCLHTDLSYKKQILVQ